MVFKKNKKPQVRRPKTGGRVSATTYYRTSSEPETTSPFQRKQPKKNHRKLLFGIADIIFIILLLIALVYSLLLRPEPRVVANSQAWHSTADYTGQITPLFKSIGNRNKLTFNDQSVALAIQKKFPEVQSARIELPIFNQQPKVWLSIAKPAFVLSSPGGQYVIATNGVAVANASQLSNIKGLVAISDQSGFTSRVGNQVLSSQAVDFINVLVAQLNKSRVPLSGLSLPPLAQELDLKTADQPYFVKFYLGGDALTQAGQYLATRAKLAQTHQTPSQYLDVRVSGKIYYK